MDVIHLKHGDPSYPPVLSQHLGKDAPSSIAILGDLQALKADKLALFCSVKCPANLILQTHDLARELVQAGVTVIGGFQSDDLGAGRWAVWRKFRIGARHAFLLFAKAWENSETVHRTLAS